MWWRKKHTLGDRAERAAERFLVGEGLKTIARNYRCRGGELDLVMLDGDCLVFVEVRARNSESFGGAFASVDAPKQRRLTLAAEHFLNRHREYQRHAARFDVVAVKGGTAGDTLNCSWLPDAFEATK